jgi:hypothetical protein
MSRRDYCSAKAFIHDVFVTQRHRRWAWDLNEQMEVVAVLQKDIPVYHEWIGTVDGLVNAAIRAPVAGYLLTQNYSEGSFVRKGG